LFTCALNGHQIPNHVFYVWLDKLQNICAKKGWKLDSFETIIFVNVCSTWSIIELNTHSETWMTRNDLNDIILFLLSYLISLMAHNGHQTSKSSIWYLIGRSTDYRVFVLIRGSKLDSLEIMIFVHITTTWTTVELETRFETWITRNDVNGVNLFHVSYIITLTTYLFSQWTPNVQIKYFKVDWSIYIPLC
jgi:hypothetical protein